MLTMRALNNEDFYFICMESFNRGLTIVGEATKLQHGIVLCLREGAGSSDVIMGLMQACYIRKALLLSGRLWETSVADSDYSYTDVEEWFKLTEDGRQFAQMNLQLLNGEMSRLGWACKNILLNSKEQARYGFVAD